MLEFPVKYASQRIKQFEDVNNVSINIYKYDVKCKVFVTLYKLSSCINAFVILLPSSSSITSKSITSRSITFMHKRQSE